MRASDQPMKYISIFSGIEAASAAWQPFGWEAVAFSEVDPFCCDLLATRYPDVPNLGDIRDIDWTPYAGTVDVVVGGSPCQAFSISGNRQGLLDERGRLMYEYIRTVRDVHPRWMLWENVPGVLSQSSGDAFETFQRELDQLGYALAWRTLDAQFYGVAQRRRRVFVVGNASVGCAAAVLFERESLRWDSASSREKRASLAGGPENSLRVLPFDTGQVTSKLNGNNPQWGDPCHPLTAEGHQPSIIAFQYGVSSQRSLSTGEVSPTIKTDKPPAVCLGGDHAKAAIDNDLAPTLTAHDQKGAPSVTCGQSIRRLTPTECERLQGFPDGYTDLGDTKDAPRYKALGNSMAVPVMRWIGERISMVDGLGDAA